jgi:hypothetical protein
MADLASELVAAAMVSNEEHLNNVLVLTALEQGGALKHVDPTHARFQRNKTYDPADTLHVQFKAGDLAIISMTRDEIRSDPAGTALERIAEAYGEDNPAVAQFIRDLEKDENPQDYTITFTKKVARESVDAIFAILSLDAIKVDAESKAPTLVLQYPAFFIDGINDAETVSCALKYTLQCGWRLLHKWLATKERAKMKRLVAEYGHRYVDPWFEIWLSLVPVARLPEEVVREHLQPKVKQRDKEETEDADDEDDHDAEARVALPTTAHAHVEEVKEK